MAHYWIPNSSKRDLARFGVIGYHNSKGVPYFVARCYHKGDLLPASVTPSYTCAEVSWAGRAYTKDNYEILVGPGYSWEPCQFGKVPYNAVSSGNCSRGEPLYIGRGYFYGYLRMGKVHASHNCLYIHIWEQERRVANYEVLVEAPADKWLSCGLEIAPPCAVVAGNESDGTAIYVARSMHDGIMLPAKFVPDRGEAYVVSDGCGIHRTQEIEVLCGPNYKWLQPHNNDHVPSDAVFTARYDDGVPLIVGRAKYKGILTPGLVSVDGECVIIPFGEDTVRVESYEVLMKDQP